jgi:hypothetical protein
LSLLQRRDVLLAGSGWHNGSPLFCHPPCVPSCGGICRVRAFAVLRPA